jgi:hypothetical protein
MKKFRNKGALTFEAEVLLFLLAIFIIWVLAGKPKSENADKPFMKEKTMIIQ